MSIRLDVNITDVFVCIKQKTQRNSLGFCCPSVDSQRVLNLTQPGSSSKNSNSTNFSKQNPDYSLQRINQPQKATMGGILILSLLLGGLLLSGRKKKRK